MFFELFEKFIYLMIINKADSIDSMTRVGFISSAHFTGQNIVSLPVFKTEVGFRAFKKHHCI